MGACLQPEDLRDEVRAAIEDRATWLHLLLEEIEADTGQDVSEAVKRAIFRFGEAKGQAMAPVADAGEWAEKLITPTGQMCFAQKLVEKSPERAVLEFSYCPLVEAWKKLGADEARVARLCDLARSGDFGRVAPFGLRLTFEKLMAEGDPVCRLVVTKE